jgi:hypothetical protein
MESKELPARLVVPAEIQKLCRRIEKWRQSRRHRELIPERLWGLAARLARQYGVARIARFARLDYYALRERFDSLDRDGIQGEKRPAFVEVALPSSASVSECIVEFEHPRGDRMRIHVKGGPAPDLAALSRSFWSTKS